MRLQSIYVCSQPTPNLELNLEKYQSTQPAPIYSIMVAERVETAGDARGEAGMQPPVAENNLDEALSADAEDPVT
jgi:hypothetical protein